MAVAEAGQPDAGTSGSSLVELIVVLAVAGLLVQAVAPTWSRWRQGQRLLAAAGEIVARTLMLKARASASGRHFGLQFATAEGLSWQQLEDGDGDGLRTGDLALGVDRRLGRPIQLSESYPGIALGLPSGTSGLGGSSPRAGVAFGGAQRLSVAPEGTMTSGTVYLQNGFGEVVAVRVYGVTGRVSVWRLRPPDSGWRRLR